MNEGYKSGGTPGGKWGCALAAMVGVPLLGFAILLSALGDCAPDASCHHDLDWLLILAALATAAVVGFTSRGLINAVIRRWTNGS
ncbi:hypothetical protein [uncultured Sphingomonas sp.]|uniref:hypothetical protein n=1 Tax=uncultured Sphingomonas sp. TaxID=158754 RepID=UPI0025F0F7CD|nr:hypothetical protein [uncultured Sphingomonas sp.]